MSGMISSCMFSRAPIVAKNRTTHGIASCPRPRKRLTSAPTTTVSVPIRSTTIHAAPHIRIVMMTSIPAAKPRGTAITVRNGPTGAASTRWYVPAIATRRPVPGSSRRSYSPAGSTHVRAAATPIATSSRTTG